MAATNNVAALAGNLTCPSQETAHRLARNAGSYDKFANIRRRAGPPSIKKARCAANAAHRAARMAALMAAFTGTSTPPSHKKAHRAAKKNGASNLSAERSAGGPLAAPSLYA